MQVPIRNLPKKWRKCLVKVISKHFERFFRCKFRVHDVEINGGFSSCKSQTAIQKIKHWSDFNGFNFSASKSSGVHFCRKRGLHLDPEIEMDGRIIQIENKVRFLGILFDRKLAFLSHVKYLRKRCERALNILKVLSNTSWGADRLSLQRYISSHYPLQTRLR
ncbi:hypothetical protein AVEN_178528-1 [Araneus ventricosus]|uniref:Reverse transcriptase domain-containing protein n=1 Tax=Araneus ventricosus TaxID=182803 RepID=A0A4Y2EQ36_ARAVE|nr:hypothetical protein AVEN_178528-1 [Araneus ventricosus]